MDNPRDGLIFGPTIEPELPGAVVTKKSHEMLKNGEFNKVPCIVGFNSAEGKAITSSTKKQYFCSQNFFVTGATFLIIHYNYHIVLEKKMFR